MLYCTAQQSLANSYCANTAQCYTGLNLVCTNNLCICITNYYWNGYTCSIKQI